jgi:protein TonB
LKRWGIPLLLSLVFHAAVLSLFWNDRCTASPPPPVMRARLVLLPQAAPNRPRTEERTREPASNLRPVRPLQPLSTPAQRPRKTAPAAPLENAQSSGKAVQETAMEGLPAGSAEPASFPSGEPPASLPEAREPDILARTKPLYPLSSRKKGESGTVVLLVRLDSKGRVLEISVRSTSGYPALDQSALRAVRSWKFRPEAPGLLLVPVVFTLE